MTLNSKRGHSAAKNSADRPLKTETDKTRREDATAEGGRGFHEELEQIPMGKSARHDSK